MDVIWVTIGVLLTILMSLNVLNTSRIIFTSVDDASLDAEVIDQLRAPIVQRFQHSPILFDTVVAYFVLLLGQSILLIAAFLNFVVVGSISGGYLWGGLAFACGAVRNAIALGWVHRFGDDDAR